MPKCPTNRRKLEKAQVPICPKCGEKMDLVCTDGYGSITCDHCHRTLVPDWGFYVGDLAVIIADMRKVADQMPGKGSVDAAGSACGEFLREFADRVEKAMPVNKEYPDDY